MTFFQKDTILIASAILLGLLAVWLFTCFVQKVCASEKNCTTPTPTIVQPIPSLVPSCTPTPVVTIPVASVSATLAPTDTPTSTEQISSPASANTSQQSAGSSAAPALPTSPPETGRAD